MGLLFWIMAKLDHSTKQEEYPQFQLENLHIRFLRNPGGGPVQILFPQNLGGGTVQEMSNPVPLGSRHLPYSEG